jgi:hypothetical protein
VQPGRLAARAIPVLLVVSVVAAGCGANSSSRSTPRSATSRPSSSPGVQANPCGLRASTVGRETEPGPGVSLLETAEVSNAQCTDDVRFTFISSDVNLPPRYVAEYQDGPFINFSQPAPAKIGGTVYLVIRFEQATSLFAGKTTYRSRESITPSGMHHLKEVRLVAAPENTVLFVIGLDEKRPFVIDGAASPPHVLVRIA